MIRDKYENPHYSFLAYRKWVRNSYCNGSHDESCQGKALATPFRMQGKKATNGVVRDAFNGYLALIVL